MAKQIMCKSCNVPCVVDGNELTCPQCGTTFVKQGDTVKVSKIGRIDSIENRLDTLEKRFDTNIGPEQKTDQGKEPTQNQDEENDW